MSDSTPEPDNARVGAAFVPQTDQNLSDNNVSSYRAASTAPQTADSLGPLQNLLGFWQGTGFSLIARPNYSKDVHNGFFLQLNMLQIGSPIMNRGSQQEDISLYGLTYLWRITDQATGGALHIETGMFLNIPSTTEPAAGPTLARLATIPHGNSVCLAGFTQDAGAVQGLPTIPPANTVPFRIGEQPPPPGSKNPYPEYDLSQPSNCRSSPLQDCITQAVVDDPNTLLRTALKGQNFDNITRLILSTGQAGGISNIPFIAKNADTQSLESVFAIETVSAPNATSFLQLQYAQTTLLNFNGMSYPHVTVGTLIRSF